jgi:hypothetical protein
MKGRRPRDPIHPRDRQIDREIWQSSRLARLPLRELTVPAIDRRLAPRRERTVEVCLYVPPPPYPQQPLSTQVIASQQSNPHMQGK